MKFTRPFIYTIFYFLLIILLRMKPAWRELLIMAGAVLGAGLLEFEKKIMEVVSQPSEKPVLRNVLCQSVLVAAGFYVGSSSTSLLVLSLVLALLARTIIEQYLELRGKKGLALWFWILDKPVDEKAQKIYLGVLAFFLFYLSLLLIGR